VGALQKDEPAPIGGLTHALQRGLHCFTALRLLSAERWHPVFRAKVETRDANVRSRHGFEKCQSSRGDGRHKSRITISN
jgi:hypothetical protein